MTPGILRWLWIVPVLAAAAPRAGWCGAAATPLTLHEAVALALELNPAVRAAEGRESGAQATRDRIDADRWPQLRLDSRALHLSEVPVTTLPGLPPVALAEEDTWLAAASAQQLLWSGGRVSSLVRQAERGAAAARASKARARQLVAFGAKRAFRLLLAAQEVTGVAAKNLEAAESQLRVARDRLEARVAARFDVLRAEVTAEEARQEVIRAGSDLAVARAQLLQALGLGQGDYEAVPPERGPAERPAVEALLAQALRARPDLAALERQVEAAEAGIAAARAERMPTLALAGDYQYVTPESQSLLSRWTAGASVTLPVLDGGRIAARRGEAEAAAVQARSALEAQRRQAEAEVRQGHARIESADAQMLVARKRLEQAEELLRLAGVRYQGGVGTATEIADAQASLARARYGLTRAEAERGIAEAELALAVGATRAGEVGAVEGGR